MLVFVFFTSSVILFTKFSTTPLHLVSRVLLIVCNRDVVEFVMVKK